MSKVIIKQAKTNVDLKEINKYYNQLTGVESGDPAVIEKNYAIMMENLNSYYKLLNNFSKEGCILVQNIPDFKIHAGEIQLHVAEVQKLIVESDVVSNPAVFMDNKARDEKVVKYKKLKEHELIKKIIVLYNNLNKYDADIKNLDDAFIRKFVGFDLFLFPFSGLNFKILLQELDRNADKEKSIRYYLTVLSLLLKITAQVYETYVKPDIDPKEFGKVVIAAIVELKKRIPRCEDAFKTIESSIGLFENNFQDYYKNFVTSKNPTVIIESFIADICDKNEGNRQVENQMKQIIRFIQNEISKKPVSDPQVSSISKNLDEILKNFSGGN